MRKWLLAATIIGLGGIFAATEVEARRIGGGRTVGAQRNVTAPPAQTPAKPAQQQNAQGQQQGAQPAAAPARTPWGGILGGLALGGLLGYFLGSAGGNLLGLLLIAGLAMGAVMAFRAFARRRTEMAPPVQFAGLRESVPMPMRQSGAGMPAASSARVPAGFDASGFLRAAKLNFLKLQAAHDAGRADEIREFTTDELFQELKKDFGAPQETDVVALDAELLELATEGKQHWASVRFSGTITEGRGAAPEGFSEVWNLVKPADGSSGWLLAGIQQMH
jgi:predicted lipid-binding transport protein (Tim44 family)